LKRNNFMFYFAGAGGAADEALLEVIMLEGMPLLRLAAPAIQIRIPAVETGNNQDSEWNAWGFEDFFILDCLHVFCFGILTLKAFEA